MAQALYELPEGWAHKTIGQITTLITKGSTPTSYGYKFQSSGINFIKIENIVDGKVTSQSITSFISEGAHEYLKRSQLKENDLLFSIAGSIGTSAIVDNTILPANTNQALALIRGYEEYAIPSFFLYSLRSEVLNETKSKSRGGALQNISLTDIKNTKIPLPPLNEQKRIVAKLDALFTRIDTAITHLQQTLELSKALFASALDSALVPTGNIESPPESWSCEVLQTVSNLVSDGTHHSPKEQFHDKQDGLYKYVTSKNIKFDGLKLDNVTYIRKEVHDDIYARCNPEYLDQLITKDGAMTGTCCLNTLDEPFSLLSSVALVKLKRELMLPHFLNYFLQSPTGQELMIGDISGAAITRTNLKKLKAIKVPLPPVKEQQRIVSHLGDLSERTRTLEATTQEKINDLTALKASLLDAAFKGKL